MGYYFGYSSREAIRKEVTAGPVTYRSCWVGNVLWVQHLENDPPFVGCYLVVRSARHGTTDWGYKPMDEAMGPCFYTCPLSYLDAVPDPCEGYSTEWRAKVREAHAPVEELVEGSLCRWCGGPSLVLSEFRHWCVSGRSNCLGKDGYSP